MGETAGLEIWPYISGFGRDEEKKKKKKAISIQDVGMG